MSTLRDILRDWDPADPEVGSSETHGFTKLRMELSCDTVLHNIIRLKYKIGQKLINFYEAGKCMDCMALEKQTQRGITQI